MLSNSPRVSICVPVRNGAAFLRPCLDSIASQTYSDFEVIVCDNASNDATESICREYAATDARFRYLRHETDVGPAGNFNAGLVQARGEYFRWQAHDDLIAPEYLSRCVEVLDRDPSVVLVYPRAMVIDHHGQEVEPYDFCLESYSPSVCRRFRAMVMASHRRHRNFEIFGLIRTAALLRTPMHEAYAHGDRVLVVRLSLLGRLRQIPERLFLSRTHATQSMQTLPTSRRSRLTRWLGTGPLPPPEWWNPSLKDRITFPDWNLLRQYGRSVAAAPLSITQRLGCYLVLVEWVAHNWPKLARDLAFAAETIVRRLGKHGEEPVSRCSTDPAS